MLRHVVMWKFKDEAEGHGKMENMSRVRESLLALRSIIPEILEMEIGLDTGVGRDTWDMAIVMTFADSTSLDRYQSHPEHKIISAYVAKVRSDRACVDFIL